MRKPAYIFVFSLIFIFTFRAVDAQSSYQLSEESKMVIKGTSSLHDWESDVTELKGKALVNIEGQQLQFQNFSLTIPVKSIKSGKSAMDKNTFEALREEEHPNIEFTLKKITETAQGKIEASGNLSIAGNTQPITLSAAYEMKDNNQLSLKGSYTFQMTKFDIEPPTAVFGTIKTGDEITIDYMLQLNKTN